MMNYSSYNSNSNINRLNKKSHLITKNNQNKKIIWTIAITIQINIINKCKNNNRQNNNFISHEYIN